MSIKALWPDEQTPSPILDLAILTGQENQKSLSGMRSVLMQNFCGLQKD